MMVMCYDLCYILLVVEVAVVVQVEVLDDELTVLDSHILGVIVPILVCY